MFIKEKNPIKSDWYIVKSGGKKEPMLWNGHNKFWARLDGKTFKPNEIDGWLDDGESLEDGSG